MSKLYINKSNYIGKFVGSVPDNPILLIIDYIHGLSMIRTTHANDIKEVLINYD